MNPSLDLLDGLEVRAAHWLPVMGILGAAAASREPFGWLISR